MAPRNPARSDDATIESLKIRRSLEEGLVGWRTNWVKVMARSPTPRDTRIKITGIIIIRRRFRRSLEESSGNGLSISATVKIRLPLRFAERVQGFR